MPVLGKPPPGVLPRRVHMFGDAGGEAFHIVAAFEQRQNASAAVARRRFDDAPRDLAVGLLGDAHAAERIAAMSVDSGRQQDRLRRIVIDRAHDDVFDAAQIRCIAESLFERAVSRVAADVASPAPLRAARPVRLSFDLLYGAVP